MAINGVGTTIAYQSGLFGEILSASRTGRERPAIMTSSFATTGEHTFMPGALTDPGQFEIEAIFDPTDDMDVVLSAAAETVTITHTDAGAAAHAVSGFATGYNDSYPFEDKIVYTLTIKLSGATTITP